MTHNERVLELLSDGQPHSHHELYGLHVIAHSRVSDLRKQGYTIEQWREGDLYLYRLLNPRDGRVDAAVPRVERAGDTERELRPRPLDFSAPGGGAHPPSATPSQVADDALDGGVPGAEPLHGQLTIEVAA